MNINIIENNKKLNFNDENGNLNINSNKNISIDFNINGSVKLFLYSKTKLCSVILNIYIKDNSTLELFNFINSNNSNYDVNIIFLGEESNIHYNSSIVGDITNKVSINHNYNNSNSKINIRGINYRNDMNLIITENVEENIKNCNIIENSRIININDSKSHIEPILLIKSNEVIASHSSIIKNIDEDYIKYLKSRGINKSDGVELIKKGFLLEFFDNDQKAYIEERNYEC